MAQIAFDTNRITHSTPRRFFGSMLEAQGQSSLVLPRVWEEMQRTVVLAERRYWKNVLRNELAQGRGYSDETEARVFRAVGHAALEWLIQERSRNDSAMKVLAPSEQEREEAERIAESLPDDCFPARALADTENDRRVIAEAVVHGMRGVITDNMASVDHMRVNAWADAEGLTKSKSEFVMSSGPAMRALTEDLEGSRRMYHWAVGACLPTTPSTSDRRLIESFAQQMSASGLSFAGQRVLHEMASDRKFGQTIEEIRERLPERTRRTEDRRLHAVRDAAQEAGFGMGT